MKKVLKWLWSHDIYFSIVAFTIQLIGGLLESDPVMLFGVTLWLFKAIHISAKGFKKAWEKK